MKIRNGFVSNSSTSSFILVAEKEDFQQAYNSMPQIEQQVLKSAMIENKKCMIGDMPVAVLEDTFNEDCTGAMEEAVRDLYPLKDFWDSEDIATGILGRLKEGLHKPYMYVEDYS